ncbi:MAG: FAD-dependent oxidoreductase [Ilumatobacteraceae bacterium]
MRSTAENFDRETMLARLASEEFDLVVVGGGITGLGVALDAATRGLRVALVERGDFASGTSSKSSKLVHGGLRYLQQGEVRLVYEALHERQRLRRNAPHLVSVLPFMLPVLTRDGLISRKIARALGSALWMYDLTGGARIGRVHRRIRKSRARALIPTIDATRLASAYIYYDAQADDARLCLALARSAADAGAAVVNYVSAERILRSSDGSVTGLEVRSAGRRSLAHVGAPESFVIRAPLVINAAGVWCDEIGRLDHKSSATTATNPDTIRPAKGVHVTIPWSKVRNQIAVVIPVPKDRRSLFVVPWGPLPDGGFTHTYVGTTDTDYRGPLDDPQCTKDDIDYIVRALNANLSTEIGSADITAVWAGLRPLVKQVNAAEGTGLSGKAARTADLSRRHLVRSAGDGIITVTGGKLTTYREMAEDTVDRAVQELRRIDPGVRHGRCRTRRHRLHGATRSASVPKSSRGRHLFHRYGTDATAVESLIAAQPHLGETVIDGLPYVGAEVVYAVRHEMAVTLDDVLSRRTRALLFDRRSALLAAPAVAEIMAEILGWNEERIVREIDAFAELCHHEETSALVSESELHPA